MLVTNEIYYYLKSNNDLFIFLDYYLEVYCTVVLRISTFHNMVSQSDIVSL